MLEESGVAFQVREYLVEPLSRSELEVLQELLEEPPSSWVRTGEREWGENELSLGASRDDLLDAMARWPKLMQRPILICGGQARGGRPPELLRELFEA